MLHISQTHEDISRISYIRRMYFELSMYIVSEVPNCNDKNIALVELEHSLGKVIQAIELYNAQHIIIATVHDVHYIVKEGH